MNYSKNTTTPIADAARFFHERDGKVQYENRQPKGRPTPGLPKPSKKSSERVERRSSARLVKMEYL